MIIIINDDGCGVNNNKKFVSLFNQKKRRRRFLGWLKGIKSSSGVGGVDDDLNCEISFSQPRNEKQQFYHGDDNVVDDGSFNEPLRLLFINVDA